MEEQQQEQQPYKIPIEARKIFAKDKYSLLRNAHFYLIGLIASVFFVAIFSAWNNWAGGVIAGLASMAAAWNVMLVKQEMTYLEKNYGIVPPKPIIDFKDIK